MDQFTTFVIGLVSIGVAGFVGWTIVSIIRCKGEIAAVNLTVAALNLKMAENYAPNTDLQKFDHQLEKLDDKVDSMLKLLYEISAKVNNSETNR